MAGTSDGTPSRLTSYVDAAAAPCCAARRSIETVDGSGQTPLQRHRPAEGVTQSGSTYQLKDPTRGNTYTTDLNNKTDSHPLPDLRHRLPDRDAVHQARPRRFGNGTNSNRASAGVDAQYGTNETWDYYKQVHGRNGIFGNGTGSVQPHPLRQRTTSTPSGTAPR